MFTASWVALLLTGLAILIFGLIVAALPDASDRSLRAIGVASAGMGLFGATITARPFRGRERGAWWTLWYYPVFWAAHLPGDLQPGREHIHQVVFIVLSVVALVLTRDEFASFAELRQNT